MPPVVLGRERYPSRLDLGEATDAHEDAVILFQNLLGDLQSHPAHAIAEVFVVPHGADNGFHGGLLGRGEDHLRGHGCFLCYGIVGGVADALTLSEDYFSKSGFRFSAICRVWGILTPYADNYAPDIRQFFVPEKAPGVPGQVPGVPGVPGQAPGCSRCSRSSRTGSRLFQVFQDRLQVVPGVPGQAPGVPGVPGQAPGVPGQQDRTR